MSNKRTLKPFERGTARARTIGRKGGIASGVRGVKQSHTA